MAWRGLTASGRRLQHGARETADLVAEMSAFMDDWFAEKVLRGARSQPLCGLGCRYAVGKNMTARRLDCACC